MKYLFLVGLSAMMLISCKTMQNSAQSSSEFFVEGNQWEMTSFQGKSVKEAGFNETVPHIVINKEKGSMGGNNGCNSFGGDITVKEDSIEMGMFMSTKRYCEGVPEIEFFKLLEGNIGYTIQGRQLSFTKDGTTIMEFQLKETESK